MKHWEKEPNNVEAKEKEKSYQNNKEKKKGEMSVMPILETEPKNSGLWALGHEPRMTEEGKVSNGSSSIKKGTIELDIPYKALRVEETLRKTLGPKLSEESTKNLVQEAKLIEGILITSLGLKLET